MEKIDDLILKHYLLEKELAARILSCPPEQRVQVTVDAYDELYSKITWHPLLQRSETTFRQKLAERWLFYGFLIQPGSDVLDIGAGSANWIRFLAEKTTGRCVGIDVSEQILSRQVDDPPNLDLRIMDATRLEFPDSSFDVVFSSQLIEHLHPEDTLNHFKSVFRVLRRGGCYALDTPSRLTGPHDISRFFDETATGFHLKEWDYSELYDVLKGIGYSRILTMILPWDLIRRVPALRSPGLVPVRRVIPGEHFVSRFKHKKVRAVLGKVFRVERIYILAYRD